MSRLIEKTMSFRIAIIGALLLALPGYLWAASEEDDFDPYIDDYKGDENYPL
jgi:hypothetical protein